MKTVITSPTNSLYLPQQNTETTALEEQLVILVDEQDQPCGQMKKLAAHQEGKLHRAISVVLSRNNEDNRQEILLQQRQLTKYHCAGLWSNACCSHPMPDETHAACAQRRLLEELNIQCSLEYCGHFIYRAELDQGLIEHELDHVYLGHYTEQMPNPNPSEVAQLRWVECKQLQIELKAHPEAFTPWLYQVLEQVKLL